MKSPDRDRLAPDIPMAPGDHRCRIVDRSEDRTRELAAWARHGIAAGERILYVEPAARPGSFLHELDEHGVAWSEAVERGQLVVLDPHDALLIDGEWDPDARLALHERYIQTSIDEGFRAVRMSAEAWPAMDVIPDVESLVAYEAGLERLTATLPVSALCFYDRPFVQRHAQAFVGVHPRDIVDALVRVSSVRGRVRLAGEVDVSNNDLVAAVLHLAVPLDGRVLIDMSELRFMDVRGTGFLAGLARRIAPNRVTLLRPPPQVPRILRIGAWDADFDVVDMEVA